MRWVVLIVIFRENDRDTRERKRINGRGMARLTREVLTTNDEEAIPNFYS